MDHHDKLKVADPLAVENLISFKLNNRRKSKRLITQYFRLLKFHALWDRTYSPYKEIFPPGGGGRGAESKSELV